MGAQMDRGAELEHGAGRAVESGWGKTSIYIHYKYLLLHVTIRFFCVLCASASSFPYWPIVLRQGAPRHLMK
jgi:hypothetical protein